MVNKVYRKRLHSSDWGFGILDFDSFSEIWDFGFEGWDLRLGIFDFRYTGKQNVVASLSPSALNVPALYRCCRAR